MEIEIKTRSAMKMKMAYMVAARDAIDASELTQGEIARLAGCSQPRISDLMNGKVELFSIEWLLDLLDAIAADEVSK